MIMKFLPTLFILVLLIACNSLYDETHLLGEWQVKSWVVASSGARVNQKMDFSFQSDKQYTVDYGSEKDSGSYYIAGEYLHAKGNNAVDISVKITQLTKDSLSIEMNRQGQLEKVLLLKK